MFFESVKADTMKNFEVLNGKLSIPFDPLVNYYTVYLVEGEDTIKANYSLFDSSLDVVLKEDLEKAVYEVYDGSVKKEEYTFYKNLVDDAVVFNEVSDVSDVSDVKEIKNLPIYVISGCLVIIIILFKVIVLGFKKKA